MLNEWGQLLLEVVTKHPGPSTMFALGLTVVGLLTELAANEKLRRALEKRRTRTQYSAESSSDRD